jgi:hypothetical protein
MPSKHILPSQPCQAPVVVLQPIETVDAAHVALAAGAEPRVAFDPGLVVEPFGSGACNLRPRLATCGEHGGSGRTHEVVHLLLSGRLRLSAKGVTRELGEPNRHPECVVYRRLRRS